MNDGFFGKVSKFAGMIALSAGITCSVGCSVKTNHSNLILAQSIEQNQLGKQVFSSNASAYQFRNEVLKLESDIGARKEHEIFLDSLVQEVRNRIELKVEYSTKDKENILATIDDVLKQNNFVYHQVTLLNTALTPKKLKKSISDFIKDYDVDHLSSAQIDALPGSDCTKKFVKEEYKIMPYEASPDDYFNFSDCLTDSLIYKAIGKELGLPLKIVNSYEHVFIRWDDDSLHNALIPEDRINTGDVNWETTSGEIKSDLKYIEEDHLPKEAIANGVYLKSLSDDESLSLGYFIKAYHLADEKNSGEAIINYEQAIKYNPSEILAHHNLGEILLKNGRMAESLMHIKKANSLHPDYNGNLLSEISKKLGDDARATEYQEVSKDLKFENFTDECIPWKE